MQKDKKQLRLLCVTRKYPPSIGGMEKSCYDLFTKFDEEKWIDKKVLALGKSQKHLIWFLPYCTLYLLLNSHKYDVIYYGDSLLCGPAFFGKIFGKKARTIVDVHGLDVIYPNGLYQFYLKLFYNCFDMYVCNSSNTEEILNKRNIKNTVVINRAVDEEKFQSIKKDKKALRRKYGLDDDAIVLLTVGRLVKRKGVQWFTENVMPAFKGEKIYYFVVGSGDEIGRIQNTIKTKELENQVKLLGKIPEDELNELYVNADIFVMPNLPVENDREGFGIVAIEASYAGIVVLASAIDGIVDAVVDNCNGYLLESGNAKEYIERIRNYVENQKEYEDRTEEFKNYTMKKFGLNAISKQYVEVIKKVFNENGQNIEK